MGEYLPLAIQALALAATVASMVLTDIYVGHDRRHTHLLFDFGARNTRLVVVVDNTGLFQLMGIGSRILPSCIPLKLTPIQPPDGDPPTNE